MITFDLLLLDDSSFLYVLICGMDEMDSALCDERLASFSFLSVLCMSLTDAILVDAFGDTRGRDFLTAGLDSTILR